MGTGLKVGVSSGSVPAVPTMGMRGGLGRTLLTAFLVLTIVPLALVGWYTVWQNRRNLQEEAIQKLETVVTLKSQTLQLWWSDRVKLLLMPTDAVSGEVSAHLQPLPTWQVLQQQAPDLIGATLMDDNSQVLWSIGDCREHPQNLVDISSGDREAVFALGVSQNDVMLTLCSRFAMGAPMGQQPCLAGDTVKIYLVQQVDRWAPTMVSRSPAFAALIAGEAGGGLYVNHEGVPVVGAYQLLPDLDVGILVEQEQQEVLASTERMAATLIAVVLTVVLATTISASVVIRQITRPVIMLTESALEMADGSLTQHVQVTSRDEIGILTYVFNQMVADLKSLYDDLEAKVVERTKMLQRANYQIQRRALQLEASLEVGKAITSVRDPVVLLHRVVELIADRFLFTSVAVYLVDPGGGEAHIEASSGGSRDWPTTLRPGDGTVMQRALRKAEPQVENQEIIREQAWYQRTISRVAIPLRMETRVLGVVAVLSTEREQIEEDDLEVLQHLANQVVVALENARAYERERLAAQRLEEAEAFKSRFLANMSHALREPLNSILGFSRLMLKGLDGALSTQQEQDLRRVYDNGQRLLALIDDILTISQIQAGLMELDLQPVDLGKVVRSLMPTAQALVGGKDITLEQEIAADPVILADIGRIRKVLVRLLTNAAKFTEAGEIQIRVWHDEELAYVSVSDTGVGISEADCERIFVRFEKGTGNSHNASGAGLGLALSKEFVEMHGGQIWVKSVQGEGSTFTFSLPLYAATSSAAEEQALSA